VFSSIWPAIALHARVDLGSGTMAWLALREPADGRGEGGPSLPHRDAVL